MPLYVPGVGSSGGSEYIGEHTHEAYEPENHEHHSSEGPKTEPGTGFSDKSSYTLGDPVLFGDSVGDYKRFKAEDHKRSSIRVAPGEYEIQVRGGKGGNSDKDYTYEGGEGVVARDTFTFSEEKLLGITAGQEGEPGTASTDENGGGGGASAVDDMDDFYGELLVAGGGGGAVDGSNGLDASTDKGGKNGGGSNGGYGGIGKSEGGQSVGQAGGGAAPYGNGRLDTTTDERVIGKRKTPNFNPLTGGYPSYTDFSMYQYAGKGGHGYGAGGAGNHGGGGGGGYGGGGAGNDDSSAGDYTSGGGGGSYSANSNSTIFVDSNGDGDVEIERVS